MSTNNQLEYYYGGIVQQLNLDAPTEDLDLILDTHIRLVIHCLWLCFQGPLSAFFWHYTHGAHTHEYLNTHK